MTAKRAATKVNMADGSEAKPRTRKREPAPVVEEVPEEEEVLEEVILSVDEEIEDTDDLDPEDLIIRVEELDPDTEIFDGGPTAGEIVEWKRRYGEIYMTAIDFDNYVIWRTMSRGEYREHVKTLGELRDSGRMSEIEATLFNEEAICEMCTLFPQMSASRMSGTMAGIPALITQQVMEASGFMALEVRQL